MTPTRALSINSQNGDTVAQVFSSAPSVAVGGSTSSTSNYTAGDHTLTASGGTGQLGYAIAGYVAGTLTVNAKALDISGSSAANKEYNGNTNASVTAGTLGNVIAGDTVTVSASGLFDNKNVGSSKTVAASYSLAGIDGGNYSLAAQNLAANVTAKPLTVSGITATNKTYDATSAATVNVTGSSYSGLVGGDAVTVSATGVFADRHVGTGKTVTLTSSYSGADASNYTITDQASTSATITAKALTISGLTSANKQYDRGTNAAVNGSAALQTAISAGGGAANDGKPYSGDTVSLTGTASGTFNDKDVLDANTVSFTGLSLSGTNASNYTLTVHDSAAHSISTKPLTVSYTGVNRVYDRTTNATVTTADDRVTNDVLTINRTASFADKVVGTGKVVSIGSVNLTGTDAANYSVSASGSSSANITAQALTISGSSAAHKEYNGNTNASVTAGTLGQVIAGDTVTVSANGLFDNKNVGTGKTVAASYSLAGTDAANYSLAPENLSANIGARTVSLSASRVYDGTTSLGAGVVTLGNLVGSETLTYSGAAGNDAHVATAAKYISAITLANGTNDGVVSNYQLPALNNANAPVTITAKTLTPSLSNSGVTKTYDGATSAPGAYTPSYSFSGLVANDTAASLTHTGAVYNSKDVASASAVTVSGLAIASISGTNSSAASDYVLDASSKMVGAAITAKTVSLSASRVYDGTTSLVAGVVTLGNLVGSETLTYSGAAANDAHVATVGKYVSAITLANGTNDGVASNYQLPALNNANAPVIIAVKTLTPSVSNSGVTKTYDGATSAPGGYTPSYSFSGLVSGDTGASLTHTGSVYNSKDVASASAVTVSGLAISSISGTNSSAASDYVLDASSKTVTASISAKTVGIAASRAYDGTTSLGAGAVTLGNLVGSEMLTYSGAAANDAHVATAAKYISAITLTNGTNDGVASNYQLPVLNNANAPVTITAKTLTPSVSNSGVTKTYDGATSAPGGYTPSYSFSGLVSGDTGASLSHTGAVYNSKDVASATTVTVSGLAISSISGTNSSAASDYVLDASSKTVVASISAKTVGVAASRVYDGTTALAGNVTLTTGVGSETLTYTGAAANDAHVATAAKYISAITLANGTNDGVASNYQLPTLNNANAPVTITAKMLTPSLSNSGVTKTYDGATSAPGGFTPSYSFSGLVANDTGVTLTHTGSVYNSKDVASASAVTVSGLAISAISGTNSSAASDYVLDASSTTVSAAITQKSLSVSGVTAADKGYDGTAGATVSVAGATYTGKVANDAFSVAATGVFADRHAGTGKTVTLTSSYSGADVGNYAVTGQANTTATISPKALTISGLSSSNKVYDGAITASVSGTAALQAAITAGSGATSDGKPYTGDMVSLSGTAAGRFNDKNVADASTVSFSGLSLNGVHGGNYSFTAHADDTSARIMAKTVSLSASRVYDGTTSLGVGAVTLGNLVGSETLTYSGAAANDAHVATVGKYVSAITLANGTNDGVASNYQLPALNNANAPVTITAKALMISGVLSADKVYDGTVGATVSVAGARYAGLVVGDAVSVSATGTFADRHVGAGKTVSLTSSYSGADVGNYAITGQTNATATINQKALTIAAPAIANKVYNANAASGALTVGTLSGFVGSETVTASGAAADLSSANAGSYTSTVSYSLADGTNSGLAANYSLANTTNVAAVITPKALTIAVPAIANKAYNANAASGVLTIGTLSGFVGSETVTASGTATALSSANAASYTTTVGYSLADGTNSGLAANYSLANTTGVASVITKKPLTITAPTIANKVYNASTAAGVLTIGTLSGFVNSETVTASGSAAVLSSANAGSYTSTVSYSLADGSGLAANYSLANTTGVASVITPKALTIAGLLSADKVYDGTVGATVSVAGARYAGLVAGDAVSVSATGAFADRHVGAGKTVSLTSSYSGADVGNYAITGQTNTTATISQKALTISGLSSADKVYDGTITATVAGNAALLSAITAGTGSASDGKPYGNDAVNLTGSATASFNNKNVAQANRVRFSGLSLIGQDATNYSFTAHADDISVRITQKALSVTANADSKTYNGLAYSGGAGITYDGFVNGETSAVLGGTLTYGGSSQGAIGAGSYAITPGGLVGGNYSLNYTDGVLAVQPAPQPAVIPPPVAEPLPAVTPLLVTQTGPVPPAAAPAPGAAVLAPAPQGDEVVPTGVAVQPVMAFAAPVAAGSANGGGGGQGQTVTTVATTAVAAPQTATTGATATATTSVALSGTQVASVAPLAGTSSSPASATGSSTTPTLTPAPVTQTGPVPPAAAPAPGAAVSAPAPQGDEVVPTGVAAQPVMAFAAPVAAGSANGGGGGQGQTVTTIATVATAAPAPQSATTGATATATTSVALSGTQVASVAPTAGASSSPASATGSSTTSSSTSGSAATQAGAGSRGTAAVVVELVRAPTSQLQGVVEVAVPKEVVSTGFSFPVPEKMANMLAASNGRVNVALVSGAPLPTWLSYESTTQVFHARAVPAGALPLQVIIRNGVSSTRLVIAERL